MCNRPCHTKRGTAWMCVISFSFTSDSRCFNSIICSLKTFFNAFSSCSFSSSFSCSSLRAAFLSSSILLSSASFFSFSNLSLWMLSKQIDFTIAKLITSVQLPKLEHRILWAVCNIINCSLFYAPLLAATMCQSHAFCAFHFPSGVITTNVFILDMKSLDRQRYKCF